MSGPRPESPASGDFTATWRLLPISLLAVVIGALATGVAFALLRLIGFFTNLFYFHRLGTSFSSPAESSLGPWAVLVPVGGALVVGLLARFGSDRIRGHGIPEALEAILTRGSRIEPRVALLKPISAAISIGSGGPFGAEGPIVMTGGAFGSLVGQHLHLTAAERKTLLVAGAAAGMSATFAAPMASVLLAVELLLFELKPRSLVPVALAAATAAILREPLLGAGPLFAVAAHGPATGPAILLGAGAVGLAAGGLAIAMTASVYAAEDLYHRLPLHWMWWPAVGAVFVGVGGLVCPRALGVGYDVIGDLLRGGLLPREILVLVLVKWAIWAIYLGSGTSGGVLAPLLMIGAAAGALAGAVLPEPAPGFWALVALGAILGGTMRSPLTGTLFAVELTGDLGALLPVLVASAVAHGVTVLLLKRSILTEKLARRGRHVSREYAVDPLEVLLVRDVMGPAVVLPAGATREQVRDVLAVRAGKAEPLYAVLGPQDRLLGVITRRLLGEWAEAAVSGETLSCATHLAPVLCHPDEPLRLAAQRMAETGLTRLPVVEGAGAGAVVGFVGLRQLLHARQRHLEEERLRERPLRLAHLVPGPLRGLVRSRAVSREDSEGTHG